MKLNLVIAISLFLYSCSSTENTSKDELKEEIKSDVVFVKTEPVKQFKGKTISTVGIVLNENEAKPSFKTGGIIKKIYVKEGDYVKSGQLLATLIMDEINANVAQTTSALHKAQRDYDRVQKLQIDSVATLEQFQNVTTLLELAKNSNKIALFNQKHSNIYAPFNGKIAKQILFEGELAGPGVPVLVLLGTSSNDWKIRIGVEDAIWATASIGDPVQLSFDAFPGEVFTAKLSKKSIATLDKSGNFGIDIYLNDIQKPFAAGMVAKVTLTPTKPSHAFNSIPLSAIVNLDGSKGTVYTIQNDKAVQIDIQISEILGNEVAVKKGLENVTEVITTGSLYVKDGTKVNR